MCFLLTTFNGKFLDAVSYDKELEISVGNFQIQKVVKKDMDVEVTFCKMQ
jgi:hypothetical protein